MEKPTLEQFEKNFPEKSQMLQIEVIENIPGRKIPLNGTNIQSYTPIDRNIVVASDISDPIQINSLVKGTIARTLPMYSVPGLTRI